jgi:hypothetical protein
MKIPVLPTGRAGAFEGCKLGLPTALPAMLAGC